jgi:hypothetical protein
MTMYEKLHNRSKFCSFEDRNLMELRKSAGRMSTKLCGDTQTLHNDMFMRTPCFVVYLMTLIRANYRMTANGKL